MELTQQQKNRLLAAAAEQIIANMAQRRAETLRLPAPTTIYQPPLQGGLPYTPNQ